MMIVRFLTVLIASLLAGTSFGILVGNDPGGLSPSAYLEFHQNLVSSLNKLMVSLVVLATMFTTYLAFIERHDKSAMIALATAALCFISCMLITRFGNAPLQDRLMTWSIVTMPSDWMSVRDDWWNYHAARTIAELIALMLVIWVIVRPKVVRA